MKLSLFSDYSLRVLMFAALKDGAFRVDEVTTAYGVSRNHVAKIIHTLGLLGYLQTQRGRGGGIQLARPASEIRIGQVVRATEGADTIVECFDPRTNQCVISGSCRLKGALADAQQAFYDTLDGYTLEELVRGSRGSRLLRSLKVSQFPPSPPLRRGPRKSPAP